MRRSFPLRRRPRFRFARRSVRETGALRSTFARLDSCRDGPLSRRPILHRVSSVSSRRSQDGRDRTRSGFPRKSDPSGPPCGIRVAGRDRPDSRSSRGWKSRRRATRARPTLRRCLPMWGFRLLRWWRGQDLNLRPLGYEPNELPDCSTPRHRVLNYGRMVAPGRRTVNRPGDPRQSAEFLRRDRRLQNERPLRER